jgi:branched-chain amino acid transport system ATP-binding protein
LLKVQEIETFYGNIKALKGISLNVARGEIVALIGSNGAGKTTLLNTISGIRKGRQGKILLEGEDITNLSPYKIVARGISQVPEGRQVFAKFTVIENLKAGGYRWRRTRDYKDDAEKIFGYFPILRERANQLAGTLSGGEQQMLAIARALMASPQIMLLDEPSLGLAPLIIQEIFKIMADLNKRGITFLLVEQNAYMALEISNRAYVLQLGEIALEGESNLLMDNEEVKKKYMGE